MTAASINPAIIPAKTKRVRRLSTSDQASCIAQWKSGTVTLDDLTKKFKVNTSTLTRLFKSAGVKKGEDEEAAKKIATDAVQANIINDANVYAKRVKDTKEEHYKMATALSRLIYAKVIKNEQEAKPPSLIAGDLKAYHIALMALKIAKEERYSTLGITAENNEDEKPLPDLIIQELTVEDIQKMNKENMVNDDELDFDTASLGDEDLIDVEEQSDRVIVDE